LRHIGIDEGHAGNDQPQAENGKCPFYQNDICREGPIHRRANDVSQEQEKGDRGATIEEKGRLNRRPRQSDAKLDVEKR